LRQHHHGTQNQNPIKKSEYLSRRCEDGLHSTAETTNLNPANIREIFRAAPNMLTIRTVSAKTSHEIQNVDRYFNEVVVSSFMGMNRWLGDWTMIRVLE